MSQNGTPVSPLPAQASINFRHPINMLSYFILDRSVSDLNYAANQLQAIQRLDLAQVLRANAVAMAGMREEVLRADQSGLVVAQPGDVPPTRLQ